MTSPAGGTMSAVVVIYSSLFAVSVILSGTMVIAWAGLGRKKHARTWSIAFGFYALQIVARALGWVMPAGDALFSFANVACTLAASAMVAVGARQRAGVPGHWRFIAGAAILSYAAASLLALLVPAAYPYTSALGSGFTVAMLIIAIRVIAPGDRAAVPAERATIGVLGVFALFEFALTASLLLRAALPDNPVAQRAFGLLYAIGLPPMFVASGLAAVMLIASDLAIRLRHLASHDPLTGCYNRRGFHETAETVIANARRQGMAVSVAIADLDRFKEINDGHGHSAGDAVLRHVCKLFAEGMRQGDLVARMGGEEFALLLPGSAGAEATEVVERMRERIAYGMVSERGLIAATASFGVAQVSPDGPIEAAIADAMDRADRALYRSKLDGRDRVTLAVGAGVGGAVVSLFPTSSQDAQR